MIKACHFDTKIPGRNLLVFGAIHGNEVCGPQAIFNAIKQIAIGHLKLSRGSVTFIPVCNENAYLQQKRYCEKNLNRVFRYHENPSCYEEYLANELIQYVNKADYLLDLHSMPSNGTPFAFQDYENESVKRFVAAQGLGYALVGWPALYTKDGILQDSATSDYAQSVGVPAVTVECGSHHDLKAVSVAQQCIMRSLSHLNIIENQSVIFDDGMRFVKMETIVRKEKNGVFSRPWQHLDSVNKGEVIAIYDDGEKLIARKDGYIILPHADPNLGDEWFYLGREVE